MATLDLFRRESLTAREQQAFKTLADTLIFETPTDLALSKKNISALSRLVQESFRKQDELHEQAKHEFFQDLITRALSDARKVIGQDPPEAPQNNENGGVEEEKKIDERSFTEKVLGAAQMYTVSHGSQYWQTQGYGAWGFTPKIAGIRTKDFDRPYERDGKNCFGVVQGLGALFNKMGLECEMGITVDHPFAIVQVEGKTYLASLYGVHEAKGTFEMREGYKMYKPSPEDNIPYTLMTVWNFDEALVYELLENFEVLRQMSLGNKIENLPGTEESGMKIAEQYKNVLQAASWRDMQKKLVPRLAEYFRDEQSAWAIEQERRRLLLEVNRLSLHVMTSAQSAMSMRNETLDLLKEKFLPQAKFHSKAIAEFISSGVEFDASVVPEDVVLFFKKAKEELSAIESDELRDTVTQKVLRPFAPSER